MKLKIGEKEYSIKFAYKPTLKERIISKFVKFADLSNGDKEAYFEKVEDLLLFLPEAVLVGLQVHYPEFKYNCDTGEGKEEKLEKAFALVEEYMDSEGADVMAFFNQIQEALLEDSFLRSLFQKEQKKEEQVEETVQPRLEVIQNGKIVEI
ncbi:hypothetical protein C810_01416 [Lachnospiraceae bacterium A2]|nr:hypothetical protein C810_01416 [Lachnospiraceae bacterium A2]